MILKKQLISALALLALTGCEILPASGPLGFLYDEGAAARLKAPVENPGFSYALVDITRPVSQYLARKEKESLALTDWPKDTPADLIAVNVGDVVQITIYESRTGGLFVPAEAGVRPGNFVTLPEQTIDRTGLVKVPYAGEIKVIGKTPAEIGRVISEKLAARAIEPEVVVSVPRRGGSEVSVLGSVGEARRYPLNFSGERILDAIARAQGNTNPGHETFVSLQRGKREWTILLDHLIKDPSKNITLLPEDTIYLYREPQTAQVFGASLLNGPVEFTKRDMSLAEIIAGAGGLSDGRADPTEVYLYRVENRIYMDDLGLALPESEELKRYVPVIYRLDLRHTGGYFLAQNFPVRNKDIVYIANAKSVEFTKFLDLLSDTAITEINTESALR